MPVVFLLLGLILIASAVRNTQGELGSLWQQQFTGEGSFTSWLIVFVMLAALGSIKAFEPLAKAMMVLVLLVLILVNSQTTNLLTLIQAQLLGRAAASNLRSGVTP